MNYPATGNWEGYYISAYGIAVKNGFDGTEEEWLESLKGMPGEPGPKGEQGPHGVQGAKGETGATGPQGAPGVSAGFGTPVATIDENTGTPSVDVTATGADTEKVFHFAFHNLKGEKGDAGEKGDTGTGIDILGTYDTVAALKAGVTNPQQGQMYNVGTAAPYTIYMWDDLADDFLSQGQLQGEKGEKGDTGTAGAAAGFGTPAATVDSAIGTPSVEVTATGADTAKVFAFAFHNLKGQTGKGISSVTLQSGDHSPGTTDTYQITYTDGDTDTFTVYNGADGGGSGDMKSDGTVAMQQALNMGGNRLINLATPTESTDGITKGYADSIYLTAQDKGQANGTATLGADGKLVSSQKPAYTASEISFSDGETFQQKYNAGELTGPAGPAGAAGAAGPNQISASTQTSYTKILKGNGSKVTQAVAGTDYIAPVSGTAGNVVVFGTGGALADSGKTIGETGGGGGGWKVVCKSLPMNRTNSIPSGTNYAISPGISLSGNRVIEFELEVFGLTQGSVLNALIVNSSSEQIGFLAAGSSENSSAGHMRSRCWIHTGNQRSITYYEDKKSNTVQTQSISYTSGQSEIVKVTFSSTGTNAFLALVVRYRIWDDPGA